MSARSPRKKATKKLDSLSRKRENGMSGDPMKATAEIGRMGIEFKVNAAINQYKALKNPPQQRGGRGNQ